MSIPTNEQETVIRFGRDDPCVNVWTSDTTVMTKLDKLCANSPDHYMLCGVGKIAQDIVSKEYEIDDKALVSFRSKKTERTMTDEQRAQAAERLRKARERTNEE